MTVDFSSKTTEKRRKCNNILKALEERICQPRIRYLMKISFKNKGEIKTFSGEIELKEFIASRLANKSYPDKKEMKLEQTQNTINKERASEIVNILINIYYLPLEIFTI